MYPVSTIYIFEYGKKKDIFNSLGHFNCVKNVGVLNVHIYETSIGEGKGLVNINLPIA